MSIEIGLLGELVSHGDRLRVARGGRGGATQRAPVRQLRDRFVAAHELRARGEQRMAAEEAMKV